MKFYKGGKNIIEFKTDVAGLHKVAPVKPANYFIPQWFKDMKDFIEIPGNKTQPPGFFDKVGDTCLLYTSPSPRDKRQSRMPSSA